MAMAEYRKDLKCAIRKGLMVTEVFCFEASRIKTNQLQFCLPERCDSLFRLCPACMVQLSSDQIRKIIEKHARREITIVSNGNGILLCKFHLTYGPDATRETRDGMIIVQPMGEKLWSLIFGQSRKETDIHFEPYDFEQPFRVEPVVQTAAEIIKSQPVIPSVNFKIRKVADFPNFVELAKAMKEVAREKKFDDYPLDNQTLEIAEVFSCAPPLAKVLLSENNDWLIKRMGPSVPIRDRIQLDVAYVLMKFSLEKRIELAGKCVGKEFKECSFLLGQEYSKLRNKAVSQSNREKKAAGKNVGTKPAKPLRLMPFKPKIETDFSPGEILEDELEEKAMGGQENKKPGFLDSGKLAEIKEITFGHRLIQLVKEVSDESGLSAEQLAEKINQEASWIRAVLAIEDEINFAALDCLDLAEILTFEIGMLFRLIPAGDQEAEAEELADICDSQPKEALVELKDKLRQLKVDEEDIEAIEKLLSESSALGAGAGKKKKSAMPALPPSSDPVEEEKKSRQPKSHYNLTEDDKRILSGVKSLGWGEWPEDDFIEKVRAIKEKGAAIKDILFETGISWPKLSAWLAGGYKKDGKIISKAVKEAALETVPFSPIPEKQALPDVEPMLEAIKNLEIGFKETQDDEHIGGGDNEEKVVTGEPIIPVSVLEAEAAVIWNELYDPFKGIEISYEEGVMGRKKEVELTEKEKKLMKDIKGLSFGESPSQSVLEGVKVILEKGMKLSVLGKLAGRSYSYIRDLKDLAFTGQKKKYGAKADLPSKPRRTKKKIVPESPAVNKKPTMPEQQGDPGLIALAGLLSVPAKMEKVVSIVRAFLKIEFDLAIQRQIQGKKTTDDAGDAIRQLRELMDFIDKKE